MCRSVIRKTNRRSLCAANKPFMGQPEHASGQRPAGLFMAGAATDMESESRGGTSASGGKSGWRGGAAVVLKLAADRSILDENVSDGPGERCDVSPARRAPTDQPLYCTAASAAHARRAWAGGRASNREFYTAGMRAGMCLRGL